MTRATLLRAAEVLEREAEKVKGRIEVYDAVNGWHDPEQKEQRELARSLREMADKEAE